MVSSVAVDGAERHPQASDEPRERTGDYDETAPGVSDDVDRLPDDVVFGLLANERRRQVLTYLADGGNPASLSDLAEHIASSENDKPVAALTSQERKRVYVGLHQAHLPKMDDASVVDYDQPSGSVELRPEANQLLHYLSEDPGGSDRTDTWLRRLVPASLRELGARLVG